MRWVRDPGPALRAHAQEIYRDAFPPELRAPFDDLFDDEVLVYAEDPDRAAGLVVLRRIGEQRWAFVRYFLAGRRGAGVGSRMFADLRRELGDARVVLDVEDPGEPGIDGAEHAVRLRRIAFYERLGMTVLPVRGYEPPHDDGHAPALLLLSSDVDPGLDVRHLVETVFRDRYHLADDHPVVRRVLEASSLL